MAHTTYGEFYTQAKKTKQDKFVLLARAWHLVCEMLYKFVKSMLKTYCAWPTSKKRKTDMYTWHELQTGMRIKKKTFFASKKLF